MHDRDYAQRDALRRLGTASGGEEDTIFFGDLHVHSSYSWDGFLFSLPLTGGEGVHPPNDACDFARYCANLDFYALTDHAETLPIENWEKSKESVRQCNERAGDPGDPDMVAFMGFEWSNAGLTPKSHYGHRCVIFPEDRDEALPARPISAGRKDPLLNSLADMVSGARWLSPMSWRVHSDFADYLRAVSSREVCRDDVDSRDLPLDCEEVAATPADLHRKLDEWDLPALSIPHGMTWGTYTPATTTIDKHLSAENHDPKYMRLIELMSGHGNSEEYRTWTEFDVDAEGKHVCPAPTDDYLPCCWQAGEIMRGRCGDLPEEECERRVQLTRDYAASTYTRPHNVLPDATPEEWLDCGQCRDCFKPSFGYRPKESVQYAMSLTRNDEQGRQRFRYGFIGSSDGHTARPGNGYKQVEPSMMSDVRGTPAFPFNQLSVLGKGEMDDPRQPVKPVQQAIGVRGSDVRVLSFLYPSGLAAIHAPDGSREALWSAMHARNVYSPSGPRTPLRFDLLNGFDGLAPMGSEHVLGENPEFEVRAVGSFEQKPGCPETSIAGLGPARLERLCRDECYHPAEKRRPIVAIEIVRIRPQLISGEEPLVEDPWLRHECPEDPAGCVLRFEDPDYRDSGRDALYYARALEAPAPALNGTPLQTKFDAEGRAMSTDLCTQADVDAGGCFGEVQERAWSSPIFIDQPGG